MTSRFTWDSSNAPQLFPSVGAAEQFVMQEMIRTAAAFGYDTLQAEGDRTLCGKPATALLVAVKDDGEWEFRDASGDYVESETGNGAATLGVWLSTLARS